MKKALISLTVALGLLSVSIVSPTIASFNHGWGTHTNN